MNIENKSELSLVSRSNIVLMKELWKHCTPGRKQQIILVLVMIFISSLAEVFSIGAVVPFLTALADPSLVFDRPYLKPLISFLNIESAEDFILPLTLTFVFAAILSGCLRVLVLYSVTRASYGLGSDIGNKVYSNTIRQDYLVHTSRNSSSVINTVVRKIDDVVGGVIVPSLLLLSSVMILVAILAVLFSLHFVATLICVTVFGLFYGVLILKSREFLSRNSQTIVMESTNVIKVVQESLGGIRDVILDNNQTYYCDIFQKADKGLRTAQGNNSIISGSPKHIIESLGIIAIALLSYSLIESLGSFSTVLPLLGAMALGAQRLLPCLQQIYASVSHIRGAQASLREVLYYLNQETEEKAQEGKIGNLNYQKNLELRGVFFRYDENSTWTLKNINLKIQKGSSVGIVGSSGSGKSTLCNIIMGLLPPQQGAIYLDSCKILRSAVPMLHNHISHVPESIFLSDASVAENIAFGLSYEEINLEQVRKAASMARLSNFIEALPNKYMEKVGERGVKLSGGQRQRIGLARALYKNSDIIIFDEATSALDGQTESEIIDTIQNLDGSVTKIMIAHRLSTLRNCDVIYTVSDGSIDAGMSFKRLILLQEPNANVQR
ncbi:ABC transporter ATP-binding protein/permease [Alphaproteobacteria bacterium]|nr:ABC transporter ATP-binding protein/permease [Alphaproteobacteria bacterium]